MRKFSRMEANKEARRILNRHGVDLSYTQYSVAGMDVRLTGRLCKYDGSDFNTAQIESIVQEFQRYLPGYTVSGDFENWNFSTNHITSLGEKGSHASEEEPAESNDIEYEAS